MANVKTVKTVETVVVLTLSFEEAENVRNVLGKNVSRPGFDTCAVYCDLTNELEAHGSPPPHGYVNRRDRF